MKNINLKKPVVLLAPAQKAPEGEVDELCSERGGEG